ncbi:hypothetical protein BDV18DRAFT_146165 [Aspergillus unguis]
MLALLFLASLLAGQSIATETRSRSSLLKRDDSDNNNNNDSAFVPRVTPGCPHDWPVCGSSGVCYSPADGQVCCPGGTYACPSSSFCLADGYCCPSDLSPDACARNYGLTLVLTSTSQTPEQTQSSGVDGGASDAYGDDSPTSDPPYLRPTVPFSTASSVTITSTPIPTSSVSPWPSVVISSGSPSVQEEPAYTGAGSRVEGGKWKGMGAFAFVFAMLRV